ncbi:response regulator [Sphaerotilus microaerophilus]|uniref:DNA-binding response regulator n=1 Tax=Sphaerotilus microaerophilus TaxID=2914710 RepID=A0ABN6PJA1_9BURK|nr:response regulator transcription factor [Sphaerotilus sp. FB-5]BDI05129.1 DNA-binding response regulator [Sphaerotilus sp. FB-5]
METCSSATPLPTLRQCVLVVDDHALVREGLRRILESTPPTFEVVEADNAAQALKILRQHPVNIATVDLSMPGMGGLELTQHIKSEFPGVGVLMLSMHAEEQYAMRAFQAGADGYLTKSSAGSELVAAIRKVVAGGVYVTPGQAEYAVRRLAPGPAARTRAELSDRELDVLRRLVCGERPKEIARALDLSIKTISAHKARIQDKLQLPSTAALIRYGLEQGLGGDPLRAVANTPAARGTLPAE